MRLDTEWKRIVRHAWSIRFIVIAGLLSGAEIVLPMFSDVIPRNIFAGLSILAVIAGLYSRLVYQRSISPTPRPKREPYD